MKIGDTYKSDYLSDAPDDAHYIVTMFTKDSVVVKRFPMEVEVLYTLDYFDTHFRHVKPYHELENELFQLEKDHETSVRQADELILKVKELEDSLESVCHAHTSIEAQFYDLKKENEELKELVEKLKKCQNCGHFQIYCTHPNMPAQLNNKCNLWTDKPNLPKSED